MSNRFRAHFDGRVLVPDEPLSLPLNQAIELEIVGAAGPNGSPRFGVAEPPSNVGERLAALRAWAGSIRGPAIPLQELRRERLYDERT